jgi:hypothetical protein
MKVLLVTGTQESLDPARVHRPIRLRPSNAGRNRG